MIHTLRQHAVYAVFASAVFQTAVTAAGPTVAVETATGERPTGTVDRIQADGSVVLAAFAPVKASDFVSLKRVGAVIPPWPTGPHLVFTNGDRIAGEASACDGRTLQFRPSAFTSGTLTVPLSRASVLWRTAPPRETGDSAPPDGAAPGVRRRDAVTMRNGDTVVGDLLGFDLQVLRMQTTQEQRLATDRVVSVLFNTELARTRPVNGSLSRLVLDDGSRVTLGSVSADAESVSGQTEYRQTVRIPWARVVAVTALQRRVVYLSDLKPERYTYDPFLTETYPWVADRNVFGSPIRLRTPEGLNCFDKGLGVHSRCTLVYALKGQYRRFEALVGLDDEAGVRGAATVRFFVDGKEKEVPALARLRHASGGLPVVLDVAGARELKIEVDWGEGGHVGDAVDLADARLVGER